MCDTCELSQLLDQFKLSQAPNCESTFSRQGKEIVVTANVKFETRRSVLQIVNRVRFVYIPHFTRSIGTTTHKMGTVDPHNMLDKFLMLTECAQWLLLFGVPQFDYGRC